MMKRDACFRELARHISDEAVVATYSSAVDWVAVAPRALNYTSIGAMGLDSSHGLGLALGRPNRRVVVLQGDGSLLMNLGSLVTIAAVAPKNFVHLVAHNETYEANGSHPLPSPKVDFAALARAAGYAAVYEFSDLGVFAQQIAHVLEQDGPVFATLACRAVGAARLRLSEPCTIQPNAKRSRRRGRRRANISRAPVIISSSWPGLSRPSTACLNCTLKTWMPATSAGLTDDQCFRSSRRKTSSS